MSKHKKSQIRDWKIGNVGKKNIRIENMNQLKNVEIENVKLVNIKILE